MEPVKATEETPLTTRSGKHDSPPLPDPVSDQWPPTTNAPRPGSGVYAVGSWIAPEHRGSQTRHGHLLEERDVESEEASRSTEDSQSGK